MVRKILAIAAFLLGIYFAGSGIILVVTKIGNEKTDLYFAMILNLAAAIALLISARRLATNKP